MKAALGQTPAGSVHAFDAIDRESLAARAALFPPGISWGNSLARPSCHGEYRGTCQNLCRFLTQSRLLPSVYLGWD